MGWFKKWFKTEQRANVVESINPEMSSELISIILRDGLINEKIAMGIPAIASGVNLISSIVASVRFRLYCYDDEKRLVEKEDARETIVNKNTGDLLNGYEMKKAFMRDYLLKGNGYIYKNMDRNNLLSLHYVDCSNVSVDKNCEPIFKRAMYIVGGERYYPTEFITITRNSKDGVKGNGLLSENTLIIKLVNNMMNMLNSNVKGGGVKKGFLKSESKLTQDALDKLKADFEKLYNSDESRVVALNKGLDFMAAMESSTELQLSELYQGISEDVSEIINVPESIKNGMANEATYRNWFKNCINPILEEICAALNEIGRAHV